MTRDHERAHVAEWAAAGALYYATWWLLAAAVLFLLVRAVRTDRTPWRDARRLVRDLIPY